MKKTVYFIIALLAFINIECQAQNRIYSEDDIDIESRTLNATYGLSDIFVCKDIDERFIVNISYVVEKNGTITNLKISRDDGTVLPQSARTELRRLVMKNSPLTPGTVNGKKVRYKKERRAPIDNEVVETTDIFPRFANCDDDISTIRAMREWVSTNMRYPQSAKANQKEGRALVTFIVEKDGSVSDVKVIRSAGDASLDNEAIRVVKSMPRWTPGRTSWEGVGGVAPHIKRVRMSVPVTFVIK